MTSKIAAIVALVASIISFFWQIWLGFRNRALLRKVNLWQTGAIGTLVALGFMISYFFIVFGDGDNIGRSILRWFVPVMMLFLVLGTYWSIQAAIFISQQHALIQQRMDFISVATHEIGTPLTTILGYHDLLMNFEHPPEVQNLLRGLHAGTARLRVVKRYNDALQKGMEAIPIELCEMIENVLSMSETWAGTRRKINSLPIYVDCSDVVVEVDRDKIKTAVMIMVSNALKATTTAVWISTRITRGQLIIRVQDDGEGVEKKDLEKLFKPAGQLDISSTRKFEGFGMGLYTLSQIAKMHNGTVEFASDHDGTIVGITLPVYQS